METHSHYLYLKDIDNILCQQIILDVTAVAELCLCLSVCVLYVLSLSGFRMWVPLLLLLLGLRKSNWAGTWMTHRSGRSKLRKSIYIPGQHGSGAAAITLEKHT